MRNIQTNSLKTLRHKVKERARLTSDKIQCKHTLASQSSRMTVFPAYDGSFDPRAPRVWSKWTIVGQMERVGVSVAVMGWCRSPFSDGKAGQQWIFVGISTERLPATGFLYSFRIVARCILIVAYPAFYCRKAPKTMSLTP